MKDVEYKCICCTYFQLIAWKWSKPETNTAFWIIKNPFSLKAKYCCDILIYTFTLCLSMPYRQSERKTFTQVLKHSIYLELLAWHLFFFFFPHTLLGSNYSAFVLHNQFLFLSNVSIICFYLYLPPIYFVFVLRVGCKLYLWCTELSICLSWYYFMQPWLP